MLDRAPHLAGDGLRVEEEVDARVVLLRVARLAVEDRVDCVDAARAGAPPP